MHSVGREAVSAVSKSYKHVVVVFLNRGTRM